MANNKAAGKISLREAWKLNFRAFKIWYGKYRGMFVSSAIKEVVGALTPYVGIYLSARIIDELAGRRDPQILWKLIWLSLISGAVLALLNAGLSRWKNCQHSGFYYKRGKFYTDKMLDMDFSSLDDQHTHDLRSQIKQNETWSGWGLGRVIRYFETYINSLLSIGGAVALTVSLFTLKVPGRANDLTVLNHPMFAILIIGIMMAVTFLSPLFSNKANSYWMRQTEDIKMANRFFGFYGFMANDHSRALDIRMYRQDIICDNYSEKNIMFDSDSQGPKYARGPMGGLQALSSAISAIFIGIIYLFVCLKAWAGAFGIGSVTQYIGAITALSGGVSAMIATIGDMRNNASFLQTIFEFLDIPKDMYRGSLTTEKRSDYNYEVEFRDVSFKYPSSDTYALRNVSLKFKIGEKLAIVGENGSGKTTFIKLLCRLYDPTEGEILLNGIDITKYDYDDYMSIFAIVFQDFRLLSFPLGENVAAEAKYDEDRVMKCLDEAGFSERLGEMPEGIDTYLYRDFSDKGVKISGGEAQKIALARALYKGSPFIILDEPTAALDPVAEYEVYSKFNEIVGGKTAIFISHRLASCRFCDKIAVFDNGQILQQGSHNQLVAKEDGKYHELWHAQAQYYK